MEPKKNLRLLLITLFLSATWARLTPGPIPSPSEAPLSSISSAPADAPTTLLSEITPDSFSDQPARFEDLAPITPLSELTSESFSDQPARFEDLAPITTLSEQIPDSFSDQPAHFEDLAPITTLSEQTPDSLSDLAPITTLSEQTPDSLSDLAPITTLSEQTPDSFSDQPARFNDLPTNILSANSVDFSSSLLSVGPNPIISKICENTDHPPLCLATVLPLTRNEKSITVESVLKVAVEAGSLYAKEALSVTKNLVSKPGTPDDLKATLKDCRNSYDIAVENFAKTSDAFATNDVGTMRSVLSAVITFVGDCEDEFAQMQTRSPLSGYAEKLTDMTSNCLAIVSQMMN